MSKMSLSVAKAVALRPEAVLDQPSRIVIPMTPADLASSMNALGSGVALAGWATAATVYAWTYETKGRPSKSSEKSDLYTFDGFAALELRGLKDHDTVRAYRARWQEAVDQGWAKPVTRGDVVTLPSQDFAGGKWTPGGGLMSSLTAEWYTPLEIIERVVAVLGAIDLDPCSNEIGEPRIPAARHFTAADDGLSQPWRGRVYMNPPYGPEIGKWVDKLAEEFEYGNVSEAIALVPARTDTSWWAHLPAATVCFATGRLTFSDHPTPAPFPSAICYLGPNARGFAIEFLTLGLVYVRLETPAAA